MLKTKKRAYEKICLSVLLILCIFVQSIVCTYAVTDVNTPEMTGEEDLGQAAESANPESAAPASETPATETASDSTTNAAVSIQAEAAVLMEASTGTILFEKEAVKQLPPASITKIMTLLLIFDALEQKKIKLDDVVTTSEYAASMGGSQVFLEPQEQQTVDTLIKCIAVASANDACVAYRDSRQ